MKYQVKTLKKDGPQDYSLDLKEEQSIPTLGRVSLT